MAMNTGAAAVAGKRRHRRRPVMAEINVTPMVDVMLVLLIIFMISAPMLVGVPIDMPQTQAKRLEQDREPLTIKVNEKGQVFLQDNEIALDELIPKLKAVMEARKSSTDERIEVQGVKDARYETIAKVMGALQKGGFPKMSLRHLPE
jgi:biopolymer transport protein TolR